MARDDERNIRRVRVAIFLRQFTERPRGASYNVDPDPVGGEQIAFDQNENISAESRQFENSRKSPTRAAPRSDVTTRS